MEWGHGRFYVSSNFISLEQQQRTVKRKNVYFVIIDGKRYHFCTMGKFGD